MLRYNRISSFFGRNREINELYISTAIRAFSFGLIGIFIPIYLLQQGFVLSQVFFFYGIFSVAHLAFTLPAVKIAARQGFKKTMLRSVPFLIAAYVMLYTVNMIGWPLWIIAVFLGLQNSMFWVSYHIDFARFSTKKKRGSQVGVAKIAASIFGFVGPVIGSFILIISGFHVLFIIVSILLVFSVIPLFFSEELHSPTKVSLNGVFKKRKLKEALGFLGYGIDSRAFVVIWPIFIFYFIFNQNFASLGAVTSLRLFASLVFIAVIGRLSDRYKKVILKVGTMLNFLIWFLKGFVTTPSQVFVADTLHGGAQSLIGIPIDASTYDNATKSESVIHYIAFREMVFHFGAAIFMFLMVFVSNLLIGFITGGVLGSLLMFIA